MNSLKHTPIYPAYRNAGAKVIEFEGWELPVQFSNIKKEHESTRTKAGLFDVSHMGEILITGETSFQYLQKMLTNDISKLQHGKAQYTFLCNEKGGTVDDLIVYMLDAEKYLLVVNAANIEKDFDWLNQHKTEGVTVENRSDNYAQIAIQGPKAEQILQKVTSEDLSRIISFHFISAAYIQGVEENVMISRTGYTGEDGFEIYVSPEEGPELWRILLSAGKEYGIEPVGLGARDTLRIEACLPLYGQELNEDISPLEIGMGFAVKVEKEMDFIGKQALIKMNEDGLEKKISGLEMVEKGIPRRDYSVFSGDEKVGNITSGTLSPTLNKSIGLALLDVGYRDFDKELSIEIRGKKRMAKVVDIPFLKRT